jgi:hypothetical protein
MFVDLNLIQIDTVQLSLEKTHVLSHLLIWNNFHGPGKYCCELRIFGTKPHRCCTRPTDSGANHWHCTSCEYFCLPIAYHVAKVGHHFKQCFGDSEIHYLDFHLCYWVDLDQSRCRKQQSQYQNILLNAEQPSIAV